MKASPRSQKLSNNKKKTVLATIIFLFFSVILLIAVIQDHNDIRQRAANIPNQKIAADTCQPTGSCKPANTCLSNETNLGQKDCSADGSLTCCQINNAGVPTVPPSGDTDGSTCKSKGGYCQQKGFCEGGTGGKQEDCSNDNSNWCCYGPQNNVPTLPGFNPTAAPIPSDLVPSPNCLGSCPDPTSAPGTEPTEDPSVTTPPSNEEPTVTEAPDNGEPTVAPTEGADGGNGGNPGNNDRKGLFLSFLDLLIKLLDLILQFLGGKS